MSDDDDETIIVCVPTAQLLDPVSGSMIERCRDCEQPVWRSPSSYQVVATVLCLACAQWRMRCARLQRKPLQFGGLLPGQLDEVRRALENDRDVS